MQSPIPFIPEDTDNTHYNSLSPLLTPPLPPAAGIKRRPPAPPTFAFGHALGDEKIPEKLPPFGAEQRPGTMTVFGSHNRGGHVAGAGHAAAGMARRSTAPGPPATGPLVPMYMESSHTPPTSSSPAASREGNRPDDRRYFEGPSPNDRRTLCNGVNDVHRQMAATHGNSFNGRRSMDNMYAPQSRDSMSTSMYATPQSRGMDSIQNLEDENRVLREELSDLRKSSALDSLHRRPMAAIAGGGFRGPTQSIKTCMCDSLRSKLAKIRQELREARGEQRLPSRGGFPMEVRDNEAQTSPKAQPREVPPAYQPPQTAPSSFSGATRLLSSAIGQSSCVDAPTQTDGTTTTEASMQAVSSMSNAEAQTSVLQGELGVQAGSGISVSADIETQTAVAVSSTASQVVAEASEIAVQAAPPMPTDATSQTEPGPASPRPASVAEAEVQATAAASAAAMQTEPPARADASCAADIPPPSKHIAVKLCSAASQTCPPARSVAAVQTTRPSKAACVATQAGPAPGVDRGTQAEDDRLEAALKREAEKEARIQELEARLAELSSDNEALRAESKKVQEKAEAFQHMAQTKAFGQMNVTILCPRAECTVSGERIEMDSWNPARLREEFEREVLPRFTRVFVEETSAGMPKTSKARSEAVDRAMQDFAETFRERLSAMLSAPNAAAAVQAAAAKKCK